MKRAHLSCTYVFEAIWVSVSSIAVECSLRSGFLHPEKEKDIRIIWCIFLSLAVVEYEAGRRGIQQASSALLILVSPFLGPKLPVMLFGQWGISPGEGKKGIARGC